MSYFSAMKLTGWRQFENIELDLSKRVTILTGTNGCGKTTIPNPSKSSFWLGHQICSHTLRQQARSKTIVS